MARIDQYQAIEIMELRRSARPIHHRGNAEASLQHFCGRSLSSSRLAAGETHPMGAYFSLLPPILRLRKPPVAEQHPLQRATRVISLPR
ncbi:MAG: hypothetical protein WCA36_04300, partial [Pseudolabrys sp.]